MTAVAAPVPSLRPRRRPRSESPASILPNPTKSKARPPIARVVLAAGLCAALVGAAGGADGAQDPPSTRAASARAAAAMAAKPAAVKKRRVPRRPSYTKLTTPPLDGALHVVLGAPNGDLRTSEQASELRWMFDRPMVELAAIAERPTLADHVRITPAVDGTFRWASTRTLIFTPRQTLPLATTFRAEVSGLRSIDGRAMTAGSVLEFTTPRVRCRLEGPSPSWARGDENAQFRIFCTQPVVGADLASHVRLVFRSRKLDVSAATPAAADLARMSASERSRLTADLKRLATPPVKLPERSVDFVRTGPCPPRQKKETRRDCYWLSVRGSVPRDARAQVRFLDGIRSADGPALSKGLPNARLAAPTTPLLRFEGCRKDCDPSGFGGLSLDAANDRLVGNISVTDVGDNTRQAYSAADVKRYSALDLGWATILANHRYRIEVAPETVTTSGARLGYRSITTVGFGNFPNFVELASDSASWDRVLESTVNGVEVKSRNVLAYSQVVHAVTAGELVPTIRRIETDRNPVFGFENSATIQAIASAPNTDHRRIVPVQPGVTLIGVRTDRVEPRSTYGTEATSDTAKSATTSTTSAPDANTKKWRGTLVQVSDLGITLKSSPGNTFVAVTRLKDAQPAVGATVRLYAAGTDPFWTGTTDASGFATGPAVPKLPDDCANCDLIAVVQSGAQVAYARASWWADGSYGYDSSDTLASKDGEKLVGAVFADRGVYKLGESVHVKGYVRAEQPTTLAFPSGLKEVHVRVTDERGREVSSKNVALSSTGGWDTEFSVPADGALGSYEVAVTDPRKVKVPWDEQEIEPQLATISVYAAAYRRPTFQVDAKIAKPEYIAGDTIDATASGTYLFGATMAGRDAQWSVTSEETSFNPTTGHPELALDGFEWSSVCHDDDCGGPVAVKEESPVSVVLDSAGGLSAKASTMAVPVVRRPTRITFEASVTDVDRQVIANRATAIVHPGEFYVGVRVDDPFVRAGDKFRASAVALRPDAAPVIGAKLTATLRRWEFVKATRVNGDNVAEEDGTWQYTDVASVPVVSATEPVSFEFTPDKAGSYEIAVAGTDARGNVLNTGTSTYAVGTEYVEWQPNSAGQLTLVPDKGGYNPGDTAQILVQSPWSDAEAIVTTERDRVLTARRVHLSGNAALIDVPITAEQTPNVAVSVTVLKGRTAPATVVGGDPGRPQAIEGSIQLTVAPIAQKLSVEVSPDAADHRPGSSAGAAVKVVGSDGKPVAGEVALWAVDEGVLRLTGYESPDVLAQLYVPRPHLVSTADSRARLLVASELEAKGFTDGANKARSPGGGGGEGFADASGGVAPTIRKDFRALAVWEGSVVLGTDGTAKVPFTLPDSLTNYRILAVASSGGARFGVGIGKLTVTQPFLVQPALPRFLSLGDTAIAGAVVQNDTGASGTLTLAFGLPAGAPVRIDGPTTRTIEIGPGPTEVRFPIVAEKVGQAAITFTGSFVSKDGSVKGADAVNAGFPVEITRRLEAVAAAGVVKAGDGQGRNITEKLRVPSNVYQDLGGLEIDTSSSALAGLQNGVQYLVEYPYGCLEQRTSRLRVLLMLSDLRGSFPVPQLPADLNKVIAAELAHLRDYQTPDGGLAYWPGDTYADPFLSARVLSLLIDAEKLGHRAPQGVKQPLIKYLQSTTEQESTADDGTLDPFEATRAEVLYALARAGKPEPSLTKELWKHRFDLEPFEQVSLLSAMLEGGETGDRPEELWKNLRNSLHVEADEAYVEGDGWGCDCLWYLADSNVHTTAAFLELLVKVNPEDPIAPKLAKWLLAQRRNGTWQNTLENGYALSALVGYYRAVEPEAPDFRAEILLDGLRADNADWKGRSLDVRHVVKTTKELGATLRPGTPVPFEVRATGKGRLYYSARLRYAPELRGLAPLDAGFTVERHYRVMKNGKLAKDETTSFAAGDLVQVELVVSTAQARHNVVVDDPLPAGLEAVDAQLSSSAQTDTATTGLGGGYGINHTELRDDRVLLFADTLDGGTFTYTYVARATTAGTFLVAPTQAEEMYRPEIFGRNATVTVKVAAPGTPAGT